MKLKTNRKADVCDAMRCRESVVRVFCNGDKFCQRHTHELEDGGEGIVVAKANQEQTGLTLPGEDQIKERATPDLEYADNIIVRLASIEIKNQDMLDKVGTLLTEVKNKYKSLENQRKEATGPLTKAKKVIDGWYKPATSKLTECEKLLKEKITQYAERLDNEKMAALDAGDHETAIATAPAALPTNMGSHRVLDYEIVDLDVVPRAYLTLDHSEVKMALAEQGVTLEIPGLRIYERAVLSVRS